MTVKGLTTPYRVGCEVLICLCRCEGLARGLLLDWYLGSQKLREILTLLCCISLSSSREYNASSRGSKKNFWRRCRGGLRKSHIPSTYHKPLSFALHFLPLVFLSPTSPLPFYLPFFRRVIVIRLLPVCLCVACLLVIMSSTPIIITTPESEVLNFKQREEENLKDAWYRICNAQNRSNRKLSTSVLLRNFYVG